STESTELPRTRTGRIVSHTEPSQKRRVAHVDLRPSQTCPPRPAGSEEVPRLAPVGAGRHGRARHRPARAQRLLLPEREVERHGPQAGRGHQAGDADRDGQSGRSTMTVANIVLNLAQLAEQINTEHQQAETSLRAALEYAKRAGELLTLAKKQCGHGRWLPWL